MKTNNRLLSLLCAAALMLSLLTGCSSASSTENMVTPKSAPRSESADTTAASQEDNQTSSSTQATGTTQTDSGTAQTSDADSVITEAKAKQIALEHAGFTEDQVTGLWVKLDQDHGSSEYDVEFYKDNVEYDYAIDTATGEIQSYSTERQKDDHTQNTASAAITEAQAKQIALEDAGFSEDQVTSLRVKLDTDDGRSEYDVEFYVNSTEYDYTIDGATGDILSYDAEMNGTGNAQSDGSATINEEEAKQTALSHAGLTETEVTKLRVKLEQDDGRTEYDVSFRKDRTEYEYEVDATTGDILSYDIDVD